MSVLLCPNHKAILNYYDSLKVYEIDMLAYLTDFLNQEQYHSRNFEIYVKPSLCFTIFDFVIVEPKQAIYIIQTPHSKEEYFQKKEATQNFLETQLHRLSSKLKQNLEIMNTSRATKKRTEVIQKLYYIFEEELYETLVHEEEEKLLTPEDFSGNQEMLAGIFSKQQNSDFLLTGNESAEIQKKLNPNTNLKNYVPKTLIQGNKIKAKSHARSKQKFKGKATSGKTTLLVQRIINCANRLNGKGKILAVVENEASSQQLKELITAEDGRSLQELGIWIATYQKLTPPKEKYCALFIDDAHCLKRRWFEDLLAHYLVPMQDENDYEYVVMATEECLPRVPQIMGPFSTIDKQYQEISSLLAESRKIFLDILN